MKIRDVVVYIADGTEDLHGNAITMKNVQLTSGPVLLHARDFDLSKVIGSGRLKRCGDRVLADLTIFKSVKIPTELIKDFIPAVGGVLLDNNFIVDTISLCRENWDTRIEKLGKYIEVG